MTRRQPAYTAATSPWAGTWRNNALRTFRMRAQVEEEYTRMALLTPGIPRLLSCMTTSSRERPACRRLILAMHDSHPPVGINDPRLLTFAYRCPGWWLSGVLPGMGGW